MAKQKGKEIEILQTRANIQDNENNSIYPFTQTKGRPSNSQKINID